DRDLTDAFQVQDELAGAIAGALKMRLSASADSIAPARGRPTERERLVRQATRSTAAHDLYLQGRYFWNQRTLSGLRTAARYFEGAITEDTSYAEAYAALAETYVLFSDYEASSARDAYPKAKAAALRALNLDGNLAQAHAVLATFKMFYEWDWSGADHEFGRAIALNPNDATTHQWYAEYLSRVGRHAEALAEMDRALALDPLSRVINVVKGTVLHWSRRDDEAIAQLRNTLELDPEFAYTHMMLGQAYLAKGMHREAVAELEAAVRPGGPGYVQGVLAYGYAALGRRSD